MRIRLIITLALALFVTSCGDDDGLSATTTTQAQAPTTTPGVPATTTTTGGPASVFPLAVGDCFNDDPAGAGVVQTVASVDCAEPHDNEIYFEFSMTDASFPSRDAPVAAAGERCVGEFEGFVGLSYWQWDLDLFPITPTAESWAQGDRVVYCALYALDLSTLTGSMPGAAR